MNQTRTKTTNSLTYKTLTLALLALLCLGGNRAWGQWSPGDTTPVGGIPGTYRLRSIGNNTGLFDVYKDGYSGTIATNLAYINGFTINSGTVEFVFENTETITLTGQIFVNAEAGTQAHLIMRLGTPPTGTPAAITLKITGMSRQPGSGQDVVFFLNKGKGANAGEHSITIQGNDDPASSTTDPSGLSFANNFVIDGDGPTLTAVGASTMAPQVNSGPGNTKNYGMFRVQQGSLYLKNVTVQNFSTSWGNGGMAQVFTDNATDAVDLEFNHCLFKSIGASSGSGSPVLRMQGNGGTNQNRDARLVNCKFIEIFNANGLAANSTLDINNNNATVRTLGNNKTKLSLVNCHITQNYGCPVRWHGCGSSEPIVIKNCLVENNFTYSDGGNVQGGGGLLLKGPATITNCTIRNNRTNGSGGGIYVSTYVDFNDGTPDLIPDHTIVRLDPNTVVHGNTAKLNGGGIAIEAKLMRNAYKANNVIHLATYGYLANTSSYIYWTADAEGNPKEPFKTQFIQNGGQVYENTANEGDGGGVYISRDENTPFYELICSLDFGKIFENKAASGKGGGVAVKTHKENPSTYSYVNPNNNTFTDSFIPPADVAAQDVIVEMSYSDADPASTAEADKMLIYGNAAIDGGGVYVEAYENTLPNNPTPNKVEVNVYGLAKVSNNTATNKGGGLYVEYGTVRINSGTIGGSTTEITTAPIPSNGGNTAGTDGGGIYLKEGNIFTDVAAHAEPTGGGGGSGVTPTPPTPSILPDGFQLVEYVATANIFGNAYIETNIAAKRSHIALSDGQKLGNSSFFLQAGSGSTNRYGIKFNGSNYQYYWESNSITGNQYASGFTVTNRFQCLIGASDLYYKQGSVHGRKSVAGTSTGAIGTNWFIFKDPNGTNYCGRFYEGKIWDGATLSTAGVMLNDPDTPLEAIVSGGTLIAHFYPCYVTDASTGYAVNTIGVYDIVNNVFCPAIGTLYKGDDVRGNSLPSAHQGGGASAGTATASRRGGGGSRAATAGATISYNTATHDGGGAYVNNGNLFLMQTTVDHNEATGGRGGGVYTNGGNVFVNYWDGNNPTGGTNYSVRGETTASQITNNTAGLNGGGVNTHSGLVYMRGQTPTQDILVSGNTAQTGSGGGIFCMGAGSTTTEYVRLINVNMDGNKVIGNTGSAGTNVTAGCGGGVYLQQGVIEIRKCKLTNNTAYVNGGGINNHSGTINVRGTEITGNKAGAKSDGTESDASLCSGGGIFTVRGDVNLYNYTDGASTYHQTLIQGNSAKSNGGGITTRQGKVFAVGDYLADHSRHILIRGNTAIKGSGGGVFCLGDPSATTLVNYIDFTNVDMINNKAESGDGTTTAVTLEDGTTTLQITNGCGGGIYLQEGGIYITNSNLQNNYAHYNGGGINNHSGNILVEGCLIGGDTYYNSSGTGHGNKANHSGGGIYTNRGNIILLDNVVEGNGSHLHIESKVSHNEAVENGGGMDTRAGQVLVNFNDTTGVQYYRDHQIEITNNKAKKGGGIYANAGTIIAANALIDNNTATENGGGINNHAGNITVYGGSLSNNKAREGKGGGVFTMVGDIDIMPFPVRQANPTLNHGTKVYNNIAKLNGGGINNHIGLVDARHASIRNNTSTLGNGGGIYCEGPHSNTTGFTIRLLCSELMLNKTRGQDGTEAAPTGRGGGIYLKYGSIYAHASQILYNEANINGGGIDNHEGNMLLYGCDLIGNKAVTGRGGGIYTHAGDITTGPCIDRNDATKSRATVIQQNIAHINGGGINNHQGNIFLNGDLIGGIDNSNPANPIGLGNIAETGHGGGIYIANGNIDMFGGRIERNYAYKGDGGGVWSGGGTFNIQKREGKPVIEIVDVDTIGANKACIHYHIIDKGGNNSTTLTEHGIKWGTGSPTTQVTFDSTSTTGHYNGDEAGCHRIVVSGLTAGTTYYAAAYATNSKGLSKQCDSVPFTTRSNLPVVITGTVSDITADSAAVYSKLVYDGGGDITERGVVWADYGQDMTNIEPSDEDTDFFLTYIRNTTSVNDGDTVWLKAYARNANGIGYGDTLTFISPKDLPDMGDGPLEVTSMTLNNGKYNVTFKYTLATTGLTAFGFVTSTDDDPELHADQTIPGIDNTTHFTATATGLEPSTTYYVSAYASKIANPGTDITNYAITTPVQFITPSADGKPVVRAVDISGITRTEATIHGELIHKGNANITKYGVCYSTSSTTPTEHGTNCQHIDQSGTWEEGTIKEFGLINLLPNTTYYVRLYATNSTATDPAENDIAYSNPYNFTTLPQSLPSVAVTITSEEDTDANDGTYKATVSCKVHNGGSEVTAYGIYWGATDNPTTEINKDDPALSYNATTGIYTVSLTGLSANTKYYVKAYATNAVGTFTGRVISFTTGFTKPTFNAVEIVSINYDAQYAGDGDQTNDNLIHSITVKGSIANNGSLTPSEFGFVYSVSNDLANLTVENTTTNEWDCGHVTASQNTNTTLLDNVNGNKKYYIRPYAKVTSASGNEYVYGDTVNAITMPQVKRGTSPTNIIDVSATLHGVIQSDDPNGYIKKYGFCWKKAADQDNPTPPTTLTIGDGDNDGKIESTLSVSYANPYNFSAVASLNSGTKYYWRAYVINSEGDVAYSTISGATLNTYNYNITATVSPTGAGTVSGTGGYDNGAQCTLTATPATGYAFDNWTKEGTTSSENPYVFTVSENAAYTANFNGTVSWAVSGTGTVSATAGVSSNGAGVASGTIVKLTAEGTGFTKWIDSEGEVVSTSNEYTFTMDDGPVSLTAVFSDGRSGETSAATQHGASTGSASTTMHTPRPRDIYPAPACEPWEWEEDPLCASPSERGIEGESSPASSLVSGLVYSPAASRGGDVFYSPAASRGGDVFYSPAASRHPLLEGEAYRADTVPQAEADSLSILAEQLRSRSDLVEPQDIPLIQYNRAFEGSGGGIYMTNDSDVPTRLVFSGGETDAEKGMIIYNYAKVAGGGVFIDDSAYMQMKGHCVVNANWVPKGRLGGGIYLAGRLYVGENKTDAPDRHSLKVNRNFAIDLAAADIETDEPTQITNLLNAGSLTYAQKLQRNNIMLPRNTYDFVTTGQLDGGGDDQSTVITLLSDVSGFPYTDTNDNGQYDAAEPFIDTNDNGQWDSGETYTDLNNNGQYDAGEPQTGDTYTNMGFSVVSGFCPVIATSKEFGGYYLNQGTTATETADGNWVFGQYWGPDGSEPTQYSPAPTQYYEKWLHDLMPKVEGVSALSDNGSIFEDTETYIAIHTDFNVEPFRAKYIYLWGSWTNPAVSQDPERLQPMYGGNGGDDPNWLGHYIIRNSENTEGTAGPGDTLTIPYGSNKKVLEWEIYSEEGLSWFSSYVNGLNAFAEGDTYTPDGNDTIHRKYDPKINPYAKAVLMNDLDMKAHLWVPIGSVTKYAGGDVADALSAGSDIYTDDETHSFKGKFDGQGHIIKGLHGQFLTGIMKYGLFGRLADTAEVKNVFIDDSKFITDKSDAVYHIGGIAGKVLDDAVIAGAEARAKIDTRYAHPESFVGGLVGEVADSDAGKHAVIHSSMAMPIFYGGAKHVGGLVGRLGTGDTLVNSFSNPRFADTTYKDQFNSQSFYYGGLVGINYGLVENCYSRLQSREPIGDIGKTNIYGWLVGTNNGTSNYNYALADSIAAKSKYFRKSSTTDTIGHYAYGTTYRVHGKYGFDHRDQQIHERDASALLAKPAIPGRIGDNRYIQNGILFGLLPTLDNWVDTNAVATDPKRNYAHWVRSLASPINDDYPLLMLQDFTALGSQDSVYIHYGSTDKLLGDYNAVVADDANARPNILIYDGDHVSESNSAGVKVYIDENAGITQSTGSSLNDVRVGITIDNSSGNDLGDALYDWHMFSTPLIEPPTGIVYRSNVGSSYPVLQNYETLITNGITEGNYASKAYMDPPVTHWNINSGQIGYFPTNTPYGSNYSSVTTKGSKDYTTGAYDFYMYGEAYHQHWINFKREGAFSSANIGYSRYADPYVSTVGFDFFDHWHEDAFKRDDGEWVHYQIKYENEKRLVPGRGYMMAINENWSDLQGWQTDKGLPADFIVNNPERHNMLMTDGALRNANIAYQATYTTYQSPDIDANDYDLEVRGTNLVGNPFQSYLDADEFFSENSVGGTYFVVDADHYGYIAYPENSSHNPGIYAPRYIHPHQGFFVKVGGNTDIRFTNAMRVKGGYSGLDTLSYLRGRRNYPLVNLICTDSDGMRDYTTVEINRPDPERGALKMHRLHTGNALIYARHEGQGYQVAFIPEGVTTVPVRFQAFADGEFKMNWSTLHGDFSYLHLIDNKTGVDVDCLRSSEYRFTATTGDYLSRFKLVFQCVGLEEPEEDDPIGYNGQTIFAFQHGDEVVVNGSGHFDVFDVLGRCLLSTTLSGDTNSVSLPRSASGVYLLRLTDSKQTKVQKMVIH